MSLTIEGANSKLNPHVFYKLQDEDYLKVLAISSVPLFTIPYVLMVGTGWLIADAYTYATRPLNYDELCEKFAKLTIEKKELQEKLKMNSFGLFDSQESVKESLATTKASLRETKAELQIRLGDVLYYQDTANCEVLQGLAREKVKNAIAKEDGDLLAVADIVAKNIVDDALLFENRSLITNDDL